MNKVLIICGPTATGKTKLALDLAKKYDGEVVSADSRQAIAGNNIVTGKDLPPDSRPHVSDILWKDRLLKYYLIGGIKVWLYDVVKSNEPFNVSFWHQCAQLVIADIHARHKLPIVVGGTGLYLKSLHHNLDRINVTYNHALRTSLEGKDADYLFNYLNRLDPTRSAALNYSDRHNPRRLVRAIEIATSGEPTINFQPSTFNFLTLCLTAPKDYLYQLIDTRVLDRISNGASSENPELASDPKKWQFFEHGLARRQLTWLKIQPDLNSFDVSLPGWRTKAEKLVSTWYDRKRT